MRSSSFNLMRVTLMEMMAAMVVTVTMIVSGRIVGCSRRVMMMVMILMTTMSGLLSVVGGRKG